jgi:hypothetical protein
MATTCICVGGIIRLFYYYLRQIGDPKFIEIKAMDPYDLDYYLSNSLYKILEAGIGSSRM